MSEDRQKHTVAWAWTEAPNAFEDSAELTRNEARQLSSCLFDVALKSPAITDITVSAGDLYSVSGVGLGAALDLIPEFPIYSLSSDEPVSDNAVSETVPAPTDLIDDPIDAERQTYRISWIEDEDDHAEVINNAASLTERESDLLRSVMHSLEDEGIITDAHVFPPASHGPSAIGLEAAADMCAQYLVDAGVDPASIMAGFSDLLPEGYFSEEDMAPCP